MQNHLPVGTLLIEVATLAHWTILERGENGDIYTKRGSIVEWRGRAYRICCETDERWIWAKDIGPKTNRYRIALTLVVDVARG